MPLQTILLVEDEPLDRELVKRAAQAANPPCQVVVAMDGAEALELLSGSTCNYDLVLLDLHLPKLNGLEVLKKIRESESRKSMAVVVLSSSDEAKDIEQSFALGANSYVQKSTDPDEFRSKLNRLFDYWLSVNESPAGPYRSVQSAVVEFQPSSPSGQPSAFADPRSSRLI